MAEEEIFIREEIISTLAERALRLIALEGNINPQDESIRFQGQSRDRCKKILEEEMLKFWHTVFLINSGDLRTVTKKELEDFLAK